MLAYGLILRNCIEHLMLNLSIIRRRIFGRGHTQYFNIATLTTVPVSHENESSSIYGKQSRLSNNDNLTFQQKREGCRSGIDTHANK